MRGRRTARIGRGCSRSGARVEAQDVVPQLVADRRHRHRRAGMAGVGSLHGIHAQRANRVDREILDRGLVVFGEAVGSDFVCSSANEPAVAISLICASKPEQLSIALVPRGAHVVKGVLPEIRKSGSA